MALVHFIVPFGILILFTVGLRKPLWLAALVSYPSSVGLFLLLGSPADQLALGLVMGLFVALEISLVLTGAIFFLNYLKEHQVIDQINEGLRGITSRTVIQVLLLTWLFGSFIEGSAGFGTPALMIAPLLASLGFPVSLAVALPLWADTTAVAFGAVGTPIKIGFAELDSPTIATTASLLNLSTGWIVPLLLVGLLHRHFPEPAALQVRKYIPFALWSGFAFTFPAWLISFLGPEFPSLLGGLVGLFLVILSVKYRLFLSEEVPAPQRELDIKGFLLAFLPYIGLSLLLIAGRLLFKGNHITLPLWDGASRRLYLFQPGMAFFTMPLILMLVSGSRFQWSKIEPAFRVALRSVPRPALAILFIAAIAQNLVLSQQSFLSPVLPRLPTSLAVFLTPFFGALGSFAAGSATVSNLLFGQEIYTSATLLAVDPGIMLSLQLAGASIGNAVALQNIAVVQAAIQSQGQEKDLLKILVGPCLLYMVLVGLVGVLYIHFMVNP
ncbi:L-lactate permease [Telluribacter sp. SYSU D00476]|uniref:L-lactate permease n=1 Tax=Telluribacter sp. SYSU D00476 TaxID=2811430 RepID=UPI001FF2FFB7|nr:L-lactate permease [Telluribacter sp. SYSU D00476]